MHWLTDVLAAWLLAGTWLAVVITTVTVGRPDLEPGDRAVLAPVAHVVDSTAWDCHRYTELAGNFTAANAHAWANARAGVDLTEQIDPDFVLGPAALDAARSAVGAAAP